MLGDCVSDHDYASDHNVKLYHVKHLGNIKCLNIR